VSEAAFLALTGPVLWHLTPRGNLTGIHRFGLLRAARLIDIAEEDPAALALRPTPISLRLEAGLRASISTRETLAQAAEKDFLEGHTAASWGLAADKRVYLWPGKVRGEEGEEASAEAAAADGMAAIAIDAQRLYRVLGSETDIAPINTVTARSQPSRRGDWIFTSALKSEEFPKARMARGLVSRADRAVEISLRSDLSPARLAMILAQPLPKAH
jgi:hypothetical protein